MEISSSGNAHTPLLEPGQREGSSREPAPVRAEQLPREAGWLLITAGIVGLVVPGVLGTPFLLAGLAVLTPSGSKLLTRWGGPSAMRQIRRFLVDLERRYPRC